MREDKSHLIEDALAELGRISFPDPAICTGFVLTSEWLGSGEKDVWTLTLTDNGSATWKHKGLLHHALDELQER